VLSTHILLVDSKQQADAFIECRVSLKKFLLRLGRTIKPFFNVVRVNTRKRSCTYRESRNARAAFGAYFKRRIS
jgi:hypothetical protein